MKTKRLFLFLIVLLICAISHGALASISDIEFRELANGDIRVSWSDDGGSGPYEIDFTTDDWSVTWYEDESYNGKNAILRYLIPGLTYDITVSNSRSTQTTSYTVPFHVFTEYKTGGRFMSLTQTRFSLSQMEKRPTETFELHISWPRLKYDREYTGKLVLNTPYGYTGHVQHWDSFTLENRYSYRYLTYSLMYDWLQYVEDDFDSIPTGDYTFEFYLDGNLYDYASFTVTR